MKIEIKISREEVIEVFNAIVEKKGYKIKLRPMYDGEYSDREFDGLYGEIEINS